MPYIHNTQPIAQFIRVGYIELHAVSANVLASTHMERCFTCRLYYIYTYRSQHGCSQHGCTNHVVMVCVCLFCICCNTSSNSQLSYINHHAFRYLRIYLDQMWFSQYRSRCRALFRLFSDCLLPKWPGDSLCCVDFPNLLDVYYLKIICWKTRGSQQNDVFFNGYSSDKSKMLTQLIEPVL